MNSRSKKKRRKGTQKLTYQYVHRGNRVYVIECNALFILIDNRGRHLPSDNLTEDCVRTYWRPKKSVKIKEENSKGVEESDEGNKG